MPKLQLDFSQLPSEFMPNGKYDAVITACQYRTSQTSGNGYLNWTFEITEGEHSGRKVFLMTSLAPQALFSVKSAFSTMGVDSNMPEITVNEDDDKGDLLDPDFVGLPVQVEVTTNEYQGQKRNQVKRITKAYRLVGDTPMEGDVMTLGGDGGVLPLDHNEFEDAGLPGETPDDTAKSSKKKGKAQKQIDEIADNGDFEETPGDESGLL